MQPLDDATLTKLICSILGGIPSWDWNPDDPDHVYALGAVVIFYGALGTAPDKAAGVRVYGTTDERDLGWRRVQLRLRGEPGRPDGADVLAAPAFAALQGLSRLGGISSISRQSMAPAGTDDNRREERTENYLIILDNLEALT
ncbi:minor capsid protein [Cryobacterium sp. TMT1-21]|uniref:minor capsid protein n=1 Tax=Cryobacterium sp. TMT1-21 TaxID=1259234 RepID=UPI001F541898|nr:minor capsid protein [Cryobacterium sp. TMT1-21]